MGWVCGVMGGDGMGWVFGVTRWAWGGCVEYDKH